MRITFIFIILILVHTAVSADTVLIDHCVVEYKQSTLFVAPLYSVLQELSVKLGDNVKSGQLLGRLYDQDLRADAELSAMEADTDLYVRTNKAEYDQALKVLERVERLSTKHFVSLSEIETCRYAVQKAAFAIEDAEHRRRLASLRRRRIEADIRLRWFVSPHDGVVVEVHKNQGESVKFNESVFRVVNTNCLKVIGRLNLKDAWRVHAGQNVRVLSDITGNSYMGSVIFVDSMIDPETQTCKVIAEVNNLNGMLRAGLDVRMEILTTVLSPIQDNFKSIDVPSDNILINKDSK